MPWLAPVTLQSPRVNLEPLAQRHFDDLVEAAQDGALWTLWYTSVPSPETMQAEIERRLALQAAGSMLPFAVIDNTTTRAVGVTAYMHVDAIHRRVEIGSTWYRKSVQRTALNTQCKLMLLTHAFEALDCIAVEFRTHAFDHQSRTAIERLGDVHTERLECTLDCRKQRRDRRDSAALARTLEAKRIERARRLHVQHFDGRRVGRERQEILAEMRRHRLCLVVVDQPLEERIADAVDDAADDLALDHHRIDDGTAIMHHQIARDGHVPGLDVDLDLRN